MSLSYGHRLILYIKTLIYDSFKSRVVCAWASDKDQIKEKVGRDG